MPGALGPALCQEAILHGNLHNKGPTTPRAGYNFEECLSLDSPRRLLAGELEKGAFVNL